MSETASPARLHQPDADSIHRLVHDFYADVRADPVLAPVFDAAIGDHWESHLGRMVDFWSTVALGTHSFRGNVFAKHMALDGVTPAHFTAWTRLWAEHTHALFEPGVARELQAVALGIARNLFRGYFGHWPMGEIAQAPH